MLLDFLRSCCFNCPHSISVQFTASVCHANQLYGISVNDFTLMHFDSKSCDKNFRVIFEFALRLNLPRLAISSHLKPTWSLFPFIWRVCFLYLCVLVNEEHLKTWHSHSTPFKISKKSPNKTSASFTPSFLFVALFLIRWLQIYNISPKHKGKEILHLYTKVKT